MKKVFLGGTCGSSTWREKLIPQLTINYYNPVVPDWTPEVQAEELVQRENCDLCLYVITPEMQGVYSIAEVIDDSNKCPKKTVFYFNQLAEGFNSHQVKSLLATGKMVERNGGKFCQTWEELVKYLNQPERIPEIITLSGDEVLNLVRSEDEDFYIETDKSTGDFDTEKGAMMDYNLVLFKNNKVYKSEGGYYTAQTGHVFNDSIYTFTELI